MIVMCRLCVCVCLIEGALVTPKELLLKPHAQIGVPQLHVVKLMQSLHSKGLVRERFNWQYLYYVLTDEGIEYLRNYLHLSEDTVPSTLKKPSKPQPPPTIGRSYGDDSGERGRGRGRGRGGRGGYRDREGRGGKELGGAPRGFNPEYAGDDSRGGRGGRGGFGGRGRGRGRGSSDE